MKKILLFLCAASLLFSLNSCSDSDDDKGGGGGGPQTPLIEDYSKFAYRKTTEQDGTVVMETNTYDAQGRLLTNTYQYGTNTQYKVEYTYDADGKLTEVLSGGSEPQTKETDYSYNGNIVEYKVYYYDNGNWEPYMRIVETYSDASYTRLLSSKKYDLDGTLDREDTYTYGNKTMHRERKTYNDQLVYCYTEDYTYADSEYKYELSCISSDEDGIHEKLYTTYDRKMRMTSVKCFYEDDVLDYEYKDFVWDGKTVTYKEVSYDEQGAVSSTDTYEIKYM